MKVCKFPSLDLMIIKEWQQERALSEPASNTVLLLRPSQLSPHQVLQKFVIGDLGTLYHAALI